MRSTCRRTAFVQLGHWDEAAASDQASWDASVAWATRRGLSVALRDFHSLTWLQYEWTQQGRFGKAAEALRLVDAGDEGRRRRRTTVGGHHYGDSEIGRGSGPMALRNDNGSMRARYVIESERWSEMKGQGSFDNIDELFALGHERRASSATRRARRPSRRAARRRRRRARTPGCASRRRSWCCELEALVAIARGRAGEAFAAMDERDCGCRRGCRSRLAGRIR